MKNKLSKIILTTTLGFIPLSVTLSCTHVDQIKALTKVKEEVKTRARAKLSAAAGLLRPEDDASKIMTRSEEMYLEW
ncbi:Uncharacterised protein, partial [Mycoplasmopsis edwardii]